jgi:CheY-like chemotaxis protein
MSTIGVLRQALVVDDSELCCTTLEIALQRIPGLVVRSASSAEEAFDILAAGQMAALITDLHLPNMSGLELVARVRSLPSMARLPIIVISGDTDPLTAQRAHAEGADAFFLKPCSPAAVRQTLENLLCRFDHAL